MQTVFKYMSDFKATFLPLPFATFLMNEDRTLYLVFG